MVCGLQLIVFIYKCHNDHSYSTWKGVQDFPCSIRFVFCRIQKTNAEFTHSCASAHTLVWAGTYYDVELIHTPLINGFVLKHETGALSVPELYTSKGCFCLSD